MMLSELIRMTADAGLKLQDEDHGYMPAGENGPWNDPDTPVRNTSHWLITFSEMYEQSGESKYRVAAERCIKYLLGKDARPHGDTFHCRRSDDKDAANGLIGQVWVMEALLTAARILDRPELVEVVREVYIMHPFNRTLRCWHVVEIDGTTLAPKFTTNQQLWFAVIGAWLSEYSVTPLMITKDVESFMDGLETLVDTYDFGAIRHLISPGFDFRKQIEINWWNLRERRTPKPLLALFRQGVNEDMKEKAIGYHSFNLCAFAILHTYFPNHSFWDTSTFETILNYSTSEKYWTDIHQNTYGFPYNCPGFEVPFAMQSFEVDFDSKRWVDQQLDRHFDFDSRLQTENTQDPDTLAARMYEATRLRDVQLDVPYDPSV